jgi:beta-1,2-mannobiose phosphorylase / 1,2-beta-oligomannan phosphorylase
MKNQLTQFNDFSIVRHGPILEPLGLEFNETAVMNPTTFLDRDGNLLMIYRAVNPIGRSSSLQIAKLVDGNWERLGTALKPEADYEKNGRDGGEGCEDARVTFIEALDLYLMAYTAYGPAGPRIAVASSQDGYQWSRIGLFHFPGRPNLASQDNKNGCFLPDVVLSPSNRWSLACLHRPRQAMAPDGVTDVERILEETPDDRPGIWICYFPIAEVKANLKNILKVDETLQVFTPDMVPWQTNKQMQLGAGTTFVKTNSGLLSLFHGVVANVEKGILSETGRYDIHHWGGIFLVDGKRPHKVTFVGSEPALRPETPEELGDGRYRNIAFPTAIERVDDYSCDLYYGAADTVICSARLTFEKPLLK